MHATASAKAAVAILGFALALAVAYYFVLKEVFGEHVSVREAAFFGLAVALGEALLRRRRERGTPAP